MSSNPMYDLRVGVWARVVFMIAVVSWWTLILWHLSSSGRTYLLYLHLTLGVLVMYFVVQRDFYLWFLGKTVFPCDALTTKEPENAEVTVHLDGLPANVNVVYWAAESDVEVEVAKDPWMAYKKFANAGVARTDANGAVDMSVRTPVKYKVPSGRTLPRHVHYRYCDSGVMSAVKTVEI